MAVRFIIGRSGTGKTRHCLDRIVSLLKSSPLGSPIYFLVPKQATFQTERELTALQGLHGFTRVRIISFDWLGQEILESTCGAALPLISGAGRQMILGHLLRKHASELRFYRTSARQAGLASTLDRTFTEMEREGHLPQDILAQTQDTDATMADKLSDLALLYGKQAQFLGQDRLDPHRRMLQIYEQLPHCKQFDGADVFVDSFFDFSDFERKLIAGLSQVCRQVDITLTMDPHAKVLRNSHLIPDEMGLFRRTEDAYRKLWFELDKSHVQIDPPMLLHVPLRFNRSETLRHVEANLMSRNAAPYPRAEGVALVQAFDRRGEVNAAARQIRQWMSEGLRYREIAVLVRSVDDYQDWIAAAFDEHAIPYFVDRRRPASYHPLTQLTRSVVSAVVKHFNHDDMMSLLKSGLSGLTRAESDAVENYVIEHQVRNEVWVTELPWKQALGLRDENDDLPEANAGFDVDSLRRQVIAPLLPLRTLLASATPRAVRDYASGLYRALDSMQVRVGLERWIEEATSAGDLEQAAEHQQVWTELVELLDQMVDLLGDEPVSADDFLIILESGLEQFDLALTPPTLDQVLVGDVDRTRTPELRGVILLGLNDGEFPRRPGESSIFSDRERIALERRGIELDRSSDKHLLDERFLAYVAFSRATERLTVMRFNCSGAGCELAPSVFWQKLRAILPDVPVQNVRPEHQESIAQIGTKTQLTRYLMSRVRSAQQASKLSEEETSLYQWLATEARDNVTESNWRSLAYENSSQLSPSIAAELFPSPLMASVSRIETFAACPFKHFGRYGLGLRPRDESTITPLHLGTIYHGVLERFVRRIIRENSDWAEISSPASPQLLATMTEEIAKKVVDAILFGNPRSQYLMRFVRETVHRVLIGQLEASKLGNTAPLDAELAFGTGAALSPLRMRTKKHRLVQLSGKIDRVDLIGEDAFAIYDYKTREQRLKLDRVVQGLALQLLTYLTVAHAHSRQLNVEKRRLFPAAALYVQVVRGFEKCDDREGAPDPATREFHLQCKPRGMVHANYITELDETGAQGKSILLSSFVKQDGELGQRNNTDTITAREFRALMREVRRLIKLLSDQIMDGKIAVSPYRMGDETPCPQCEFRSVCRFDLSTGDSYDPRSVEKRESVLKRLTGAESEADDAT
jgi:ATP-dependent helicase/nuclease subunit B